MPQPEQAAQSTPHGWDRSNRRRHSSQCLPETQHCRLARDAVVSPVTAVDPDLFDEAQLDDLRGKLAGMSQAALATAYEFYRMACGLREDGIPREATMQRFWQVWEECRRRSERYR